MARGVIKDPDPPTRVNGAIVGNRHNHISLGSLYVHELTNDTERKCYPENLKDAKGEKPVLIYINNLGYNFCKKETVWFDIIVVDPDESNPKLIAINILPIKVYEQQQNC